MTQVDTAPATTDAAEGVVLSKTALAAVAACFLLMGVLAAALSGIPTLIHEQNGVMGRANRLLAPRVRAIATGFPGVVEENSGLAAKTKVTGEGLEHLRSLRNLRTLHLTNEHLTDSVCLTLQKIGLLRAIRLSFLNSTQPVGDLHFFGPSLTDSG